MIISKTHKGIVYMLESNENGVRAIISAYDYTSEYYQFRIQAEAEAKNVIDQYQD